MRYLQAELAATSSNSKPRAGNLQTQEANLFLIYNVFHAQLFHLSIYTTKPTTINNHTLQTVGVNNTWLWQTGHHFTRLICIFLHDWLLLLEIPPRKYLHPPPLAGRRNPRTILRFEGSLWYLRHYGTTSCPTINKQDKTQTVNTGQQETN